MSETESDSIFSIRYRLTTPEFRKVFLEAAFFNRVYGPNKSRVVFCKKKDKYYLGILMPHFPGKPFSRIEQAFCDKNHTVGKRSAKFNKPVALAMADILSK